MWGWINQKLITTFLFGIQKVHKAIFRPWKSYKMVQSKLTSFTTFYFQKLKCVIWFEQPFHRNSVRSNFANNKINIIIMYFRLKNKQNINSDRAYISILPNMQLFAFHIVRVWCYNSCFYLLLQLICYTVVCFVVGSVCLWRITNDLPAIYLGFLTMGIQLQRKLVLGNPLKRVMNKIRFSSFHVTLQQLQ